MKRNIAIIVIALSMLVFNMTYAKYDEKRGSDYLYAAALAYCPSNLVMKRQCKAATKTTEKIGMAPLHSMSNNGGEDVIYYTILLRQSHKEIIIGFSGTIGHKQLINEILKDLPTKYNIHDIPGASVLNYFYSHYVKDFRTDLLSKIKEYTTKYKGYKLVFAGHSLGGALTVHAAADVILSGLADKNEVNIFTYGQPRVGNPKFNEAWTPKVKELYRLIHYKDLVAHVPPCIRGIKTGCHHDGLLPYYPFHPAQEIFYNLLHKIILNFKTYKQCNSTSGEDPTCSDDAFNISIDDHTHYFGIGVGGYHNHDAEYDFDEVYDLLKISQ